MDRNDFAALLRSLASAPSRRDVLVGLGRAGGGTLLLTLTLGDSAALGKGKSKHKKKRQRRRKCRPKCAGKTCGGNGCGGFCGRCLANQACQGGSCVCACPAGKVCLGNGSCATVCLEGGCATGCACSDPSVEGPRHCIVDNLTCADVPQVCISTVDCPPGQQCQEAQCTIGGPIERRCVPLCSP